MCSDCRVREPAHGGRVHPAALPGHPGEHGAQQPDPVPEDCRGDHCGAAHFPPASVSVHPAMGGFIPIFCLFKNTPTFGTLKYYIFLSITNMTTHLKFKISNGFFKKVRS